MAAGSGTVSITVLANDSGEAERDADEDCGDEQ